MKKSSAEQKARIEKKAEQKKIEKKAAEKKAAKKEKEERLKDKKSDTVTISARSIEELLSKIETYNFNTRSDSVQTAGERQVGQNFDFRG